MHWGFSGPQVLRLGMNGIFTTGDGVLLRVSRPTAPGDRAIALARALTRLGLRVPTYARDEPFIDVMPPGSHPETRSVRASNMLRIAVHRPDNGDQLVILVVEDNLVKGAAGQGVQCMNIMFGLEETTGLMQVPVLP